MKVEVYKDHHGDHGEDGHVEMAWAGHLGGSLEEEPVGTAQARVREG